MTGTTPLRVLQVTPRYAPSRGGVETHVQHLSMELARQGVDVEVATTGAPGVAVRDGVTVRRFAALAPGGNYHLSTDMASFIRTERDRFDLIHAHSYHSLTTLTAGLCSGATPFVITAHYHGAGHSRFRQALHVPYRWVGTRLLQRAAAVICVSEAERRLILELDPKLISRCSYIPNGISDWYLEKPAGGDRESSQLLCVARLESYKNIDLVIEALNLLPPQFRLVIVGAGPGEASLKRLVRALNLDARVTFAGVLSDEALRQAYARSTVYVSLSSHEAFGLTLLEAAAMGCPVVASDLPSYLELRSFADGISILPERSPVGEIAEATLAAVGTPARLKDPSRLRWSTLAASTIERYRQVLAEAS